MSEISGLNRLTENAKSAVVLAAQKAEEFHNMEVKGVHLFIAILSKPSTIIERILNNLNLDTSDTLNSLMNSLKEKSEYIQQKPKFSEQLKQIINHSYVLSSNLNHVYVGVEHLLLSILDTVNEPFVQELVSVGITKEIVEKELKEVGSYMPGVLSQEPDKTSTNSANGTQFNGGFLDSDNEEESLPYFARDMNLQALNNEFMNITGREAEIERLIHILARKTKNNPILVGDAGVGKTAVVQGFVQRIVNQDVPPSFLDKQVLSLEVASLMAGAKVRGDLEERILSVVNEAINAGNKILFIDEIHMIVGAGSQGGRDSMDIANILKPYLADPRLRIIGATTVAEYRRNFEEDPALTRRFQAIDIEEISQTAALQILKNLKPEFESYHNVKIKDEAVKAAVELSNKYITDRFLPDKAIDLIDEAAAGLRVGVEVELEPELARLGGKLIDVRRKKEDAIAAQDLVKAYTLKHEEEDISLEIEDVMEGKGKAKRKTKVVDTQLIQSVVVKWTKIPLAASNIDFKKLKELRATIGKYIFGQDHVLDATVNALKRTQIGLQSDKRPLSSFLFLGPTGVGKTELAKTIAKELFGDENLLVQLNMSEFMESHSVSKLLGAPPGYIGYQEGGQLTERIKRKPYSVVLFDEIEKAHPEVLNILLQILEEGTLEDGRGKKANFKNTVVILTSNIGAEEVAKNQKIGFNISTDDIENAELDKEFEQMRDEILEELREQIRPEIINRLDEVLVFRGLNEKDCLSITKQLVDNFVSRALDKHILLEVPKQVIKWINEQGYSKEYGARNLRRKVQEVLEAGLANHLIDNNLKPQPKKELKVKVRLDKDKVVFE